MPKAAGKARKVKTTKGKAASGKLTFTWICTGGCEGHTQELSKALYKKHPKFRELDETTDTGNMPDDLASPCQANIQHSQHNESVSFQIAIQATSLQYIFFSHLVLCLSSLHHWLRPLRVLNCLSLNHLPCWHPLITLTHLCKPAPAALPLHIYQI